MCDNIIWPPAPFKSCYLASNLKEVARAWRTVTESQRNVQAVIAKNHG